MHPSVATDVDGQWVPMKVDEKGETADFPLVISWRINNFESCPKNLRNVMPNFIYSLAGTITALAISLGVIHFIDSRSPTTSGKETSGASETKTADAMPNRPASSPAAQFTEFSRPDLHVDTIGPYEYEPSVGIRTTAHKHRTGAQHGQRTWYSFIPNTQAKPLPVVILFHGAGRTGLSMIDMWQGVARKHGVILIAPNSASKRWPYSQPNAQFIEHLLDEVDEETTIDRNRVFLFGHSSGGVYAQVLVNRKTGPWRAAATHGGFATSEHLSPAAQAKPLRMYIGSLEQSFPTAPARQMGQFLAEAGHKTDLVIIPFQTHWFYDSGPKIAEDSWKWFSTL